ncbi:MAG: hypothetical protein HW400_755 [Candidatus Levybacteria bacterium]|nr:hypothetical protein [Candidatus Levybacteria bacterium]
MDNHPIPQDVTGFQFKLIGNMTVKQFAYLATGVVFAWILFQLPINVLIKFPFCAFSAILGTGLAYFPISGRPMDVMIGNYIKALLRPTQFVYEKTGGQIYFPNNSPAAVIKNIKQYANDFSPFPKDKLKTYLESMSVQRGNKVNVPHLPEPSPVLIVRQVNPQINPLEPNILPKPLIEQAPIVPQPAAITQPVSQQGAQQIKPAAAIKPQQEEPIQPVMQVIKQAKPAFKGFGKPLNLPSAPESANLITGITKDARGNALSNILVEVKDKQGNPVRAFKTNEVGRFASATPLTNGDYFLEFEDPKAQNKFEKMTVNVTGQIIQPIEIISIDTREELRRSLFATRN